MLILKLAHLTLDGQIWPQQEWRLSGKETLGPKQPMHCRRSSSLDATQQALVLASAASTQHTGMNFWWGLAVGPGIGVFFSFFVRRRRELEDMGFHLRAEGGVNEAAGSEKSR
jgi:hypothetical protein